jgi:hypothetical protein
MTAAVVKKAYQDILNELAGEHITCAGFFDISATCVGQSNTSLQQRSESASKAMVERSYLMTKKAGMKIETIPARYKLKQNDMTKALGADCRNLSILIADYGESCRKLARGCVIFVAILVDEKYINGKQNNFLGTSFPKLFYKSFNNVFGRYRRRSRFHIIRNNSPDYVSRHRPDHRLERLARDPQAVNDAIIRTHAANCARKLATLARTLSRSTRAALVSAWTVLSRSTATSISAFTPARECWWAVT